MYMHIMAYYLQHFFLNVHEHYGWLFAGMGIPISFGYNIEALPSTRYFGLMRKLAKSGQDGKTISYTHLRI